MIQLIYIYSCGRHDVLSFCNSFQHGTNVFVSNWTMSTLAADMKLQAK